MDAVVSVTRLPTLPWTVAWSLRRALSFLLHDLLQWGNDADKEGEASPCPLDLPRGSCFVTGRGIHKACSPHKWVQLLQGAL